MKAGDTDTSCRPSQEKLRTLVMDTHGTADWLGGYNASWLIGWQVTMPCG